jgi:hypothetical protein
MIGVIAKPSEHGAVREFFELFKTPWELYRSHRDYEVLVCADSTAVQSGTAKLTVIYGSEQLPFDNAEGIQLNSKRSGPRILLARGMRLPLYRDSATFACKGNCILVDEESGQPVSYVIKDANGCTVVRLGYNIFEEITALLSDGQPCANASIPSLEFHICVLRDLIVGRGIPLVEIPPVPKGHRFIACLTHDVDHPSIRRHKFDHTIFGFLYRAVVGSLFDALRGRTCLRTLLTNWMAALKLPFVYLGLAKDFWNDFSAYTALEAEARSSFFVIPFKHRPGRESEHQAPSFRACSYGAADIATEIRQLVCEDHEIGLHGIDAWHDSSRAREELEEIRRITGQLEIGVRMHWLYFDKDSPEVLDRVGVDYDSTVGYNEAVGYRAGTTQVFKPLRASKLLEVPLHIMDTALFLRGRQHLSQSQASKLVEEIINNAVRFGGVVTVNWHDRSIAPERLWRDFYVNLLDEFRKRGAWLASARQTVLWFRKRRSATFDELDSKSGAHLASTLDSTDYDLPGLFLRVHNASVAGQLHSVVGPCEVIKE